MRIDEQVGVLVHTDRAEPMANPLIVGWFADPARDHHRKFEFIHLDDLAVLVVNGGLIGDFQLLSKRQAFHQKTLFWFSLSLLVGGSSWPPQ